LVDLQRTVYPHSGLPSAAGQAQDREVRQRKTDVLPLCYATNRRQGAYVLLGVCLSVSKSYWSLFVKILPEIIFIITFFIKSWRTEPVLKVED